MSDISNNLKLSHFYKWLYIPSRILGTWMDLPFKWWILCSLVYWPGKVAWARTKSLISGVSWPSISTSSAMAAFILWRPWQAWMKNIFGFPHSDGHLIPPKWRSIFCEGTNENSFHQRDLALTIWGEIRDVHWELIRFTTRWLQCWRRRTVYTFILSRKRVSYLLTS